MQTSRLSMGKQSSRPRGSRLFTPPMRRLIDRLGYLPSFEQIARDTGLLRKQISYILLCQRATKRVRKAVARWAQMRERDLFADCDARKGTE